jgi:hypothetical protein
MLLDQSGGFGRREGDLFVLEISQQFELGLRTKGTNMGFSIDGSC